MNCAPLFFEAEKNLRSWMARVVAGSQLRNILTVCHILAYDLVKPMKLWWPKPKRHCTDMSKVSASIPEVVTFFGVINEAWTFYRMTLSLMFSTVSFNYQFESSFGWEAPVIPYKHPCITRWNCKIYLDFSPGLLVLRSLLHPLPLFPTTESTRRKPSNVVWMAHSHSHKRVDHVCVCGEES